MCHIRCPFRSQLDTNAHTSHSHTYEVHSYRIGKPSVRTQREFVKQNPLFFSAFIVRIELEKVYVVRGRVGNEFVSNWYRIGNQLVSQIWSLWLHVCICAALQQTTYRSTHILDNIIRVVNSCALYTLTGTLHTPTYTHEHKYSPTTSNPPSYTYTHTCARL